MLVFFLLLLISSCVCRSSSRVVVLTYTGTTDAASNISSFKGVRYAQAPVGSLRFKPPVPLDASDDLHQLAVDFGAVCPQLPNKFFSPAMMTNMSEDCLTLNVWSDLSLKNAPVMVFIYGGAFLNGASSQAIYDGTKLAREGKVVFVSLNYRLGPLGFFSHPELGSNVGLLDQRLALQWVQDNIRSFGGDPRRVTLLGESAGGISTCMHMVSEASWPLFSSAIIESGACAVDVFPTSEQMYAQGDKLARAVGCASSDVSCLQAAPYTHVIKALPLKNSLFYGSGVTWGPTIDLSFLLLEPRVAFQSGLSHDIPVMLGTNYDEGSLFTPNVTSLTVPQYHKAVEDLLVVPQLAATVLLLYPASDYESPADAWRSLITDSMFVCPSRFLARSMANDLLHSSFRDVYVYSFRHTNSWAPAPSSFYGAYHTSELPYWTGNQHSLVFGNVTFTREERALSSQMQSAWVSFAHTGAPGGHWPRYDFLFSKLAVFSTGNAETTDHYRQKFCDEWFLLQGG